MYYTIYKTTNIINNKEYIGAHKTTNLQDNYLGSGVHLKRAIKKYSKESFNKEILFRARSEKIMYWIEGMIVDDDYVKNSNTYNMTTGGFGGFSHIAVDGENNPNFGNRWTMSEETKLKVARYGKDNGMYGKTHTPEVKKLLSEINSIPLAERVGKEKADELNKKTSERFKGKPKSIEQRKKMSIAAKKRLKNQPTIECPHCGKNGKGSAMKQWHFNNCKLKS